MRTSVPMWFVRATFSGEMTSFYKATFSGEDAAFASPPTASTRRG
ncbi:hypothetical protein OG921_16090 [Aldersonia sp. NBC_00410]|nr:hypothetical protein [Aldersonia sp. NBC_00410]MCX5044687.1 hypothetical protein [Aldersonia sp. NBC_00410]